MNKILHVLVFVFLALAGTALFFELQLNSKRTLLTDRNRLQEDYLIKIAKTIEKAEPSKDQAPEIKKDNSAVEARLVDSPDMENVIEEYPAHLEQANLDTYNWDNNQPLMRGKGTEDEILSKLFDSAKTQQARLNSTRAALTDLRGKLEVVVNELNKIKPEARQDKVTIEEQKERIAKVEGEKSGLENQITKLKSRENELNAEITSLKDEVNTAKDETEAAKEEVAKAQKLIEQLKKLLQESIQTQGSRAQAGGAAVTTLPAGDKGKIVEADNENMFAIIEFSEEAMNELKGGDAAKPLPSMEFGVKRPGFKGPSGEFVGRIRIRQEVKGKNFVICDILGAWEQSKLTVNDVIFAD